MNLQINKQKTRFSATHHTTSNLSQKLAFFYQITEEKFRPSHVKTNRDLVSFTSKCVPPHESLVNNFVSFSVNDMLYISESHKTVTFSTGSQEKTFPLNKYRPVKGAFVTDFVKESAAIKTIFVQTAGLICINKFVKEAVISSVDKHAGAIKAAPNFIDSKEYSRTVFNNLTRKARHQYLFYNFLFKKNASEFFNYFRNTPRRNNSRIIEKGVRLQSWPVTPAAAVVEQIFTQDWSQIKMPTEYVPQKKRKLMIRRDRWKRLFLIIKSKKPSNNAYRQEVFKAKSRSKSPVLSFNRRQNIRKNVFQISRALYGYRIKSQTSLQVFKQGKAYKASNVRPQKNSGGIVKSITRTRKEFTVPKTKKVFLSNYGFVGSRGLFPITNQFSKKISRRVLKENDGGSDRLDFSNKKHINSIKSYTHSSGIMSQARQNNSAQKKVSSSYINSENMEAVLKRRMGTDVSLYRINALSFTRFSFNWALKEKEFTVKKIKKEIPDRSWDQYVSFINEKRAKKSSRIPAKHYALNSNSIADPLWWGHRVNQSSFVKAKNMRVLKQNKFRNKKSVKNSSLFRKALEKERTRQYRYTAVYIKDLLRISFVAFYYKHAQLAIEFIAFVLKKLPRNRKETKFLRFIIKLRKVFSAQRKEIMGLRVRFQGRVNRWRRTKHIVGQKGVQPLHSYDTYIAFGRAQAITRKGAFGRRLWIVYRPFFVTTYAANFMKYKNSAKQIYWIESQTVRELQSLL